MSNLMPFGGNRRQVARADEFDALDRRTRFEAAQIKADADIEHFRDLTEARLARPGDGAHRRPCPTRQAADARLPRSRPVS